MTDASPELLGLRVVTQMQRQHRSVLQLAEGSGLALNIVQRVCKGKGKRVSAWTVKALAQALEVTSDYLLGLQEHPQCKS